MKILFLLPLCALSIIGCSDATRESQVLILDTIQNDCQETYYQGEEELAELQEQLKDKSQTNEFLTKLKKTYSYFQETNMHCASEIAYLESIKLKLFNNQDNGVLKNHNYQCNPNPMELKNFKSSEDFHDFTEAGDEIQKQTYELRGNLCRIIASSTPSANDRKHFFSDPNIRQFKNKQELELKLDAALKSSNVSPDDIETLKQLYISLSISEDYWTAIMDDIASNEDALAVLLSLEKSILHARLMTFKLVRSRICMSSFNFTTIQPVINGATCAHAGDTVLLEVFVAGFNENSPLEIDQLVGGKLMKIENGKAYIKATKGNENESIIRGNLLVRNKAGIIKTLPWEHRLKITN